VALCQENRVNPVTDYLSKLRWDGVPRLDRWVVDYLGASDTELNRAIGRKALIAGVRRPRQPGCKFDYIIVLEGPEGILKSTVIEILAEVRTNFNDQTIFGKKDQQAQENMLGVWLYECAEMTGFDRSKADEIKAFASRTVDRCRPAYGHGRKDQERQCVFWGTTNDQDYLKSDTGNRRFLAAACCSR